MRLKFQSHISLFEKLSSKGVDNSHFGSVSFSMHKITRILSLAGTIAGYRHDK